MDTDAHMSRNANAYIYTNKALEPRLGTNKAIEKNSESVFRSKKQNICIIQAWQEARKRLSPEFRVGNTTIRASKVFGTAQVS